MALTLKQPNSYLLQEIRRLFGLEPDHNISFADPVTISAQRCAAARAYETMRGADALINDPYAEVLAGKELSRARKAFSKRVPRILVRTKYFDEFATEHLTHCRQLVLVGAGMDSRAYRLEALNESHVVFEIDSSTVLKAKEALLSKIQPTPTPRCRLVRVEGDVTKDEWKYPFLGKGFNTSQKTVWILEGLFYYLEPEEVLALLKTVRSLSAPGSWVCFSAVTSLNPNRRAPGATFKSACPSPALLVTQAGFCFHKSDKLGGENANYGRWNIENDSKTIYVTCYA